MKKLVSLFFLIGGIICIFAIPATAPLPTDRISFALQMYAEILSAGTALLGYALYRKALNKEFGVVIA